jgi:uncharacterized membrane protein
MNQTFLDVLLIVHFIGLMMGAGGGLGSTVVMAHARSLPEDKSEPVRAVGPALAHMATAGVVLMLLSGGAMVSTKYGGFGGMPPTFWIKMIFVATLTLAVILIEVTYGQVKKGNAKAAAMLPRLGPVAGISAILAVVFAALSFQ